MASQSVMVGWVIAGAIAGGYLYLSNGYGPSTDAPVENEPAEPVMPTTEEPTVEDEVVLDVSPPDVRFDLDVSEPYLPSPFPETLSICGSMQITHAPNTNEELEITRYRQFMTLNDVSLAMAPVEDGCFSSGFGPRGLSLHKGIDIHNPEPVEIYAAAAGTVKEKLYRDDYGNMIVVDHGNGVFTRYAHLSSFADGLEVDAALTQGQVIGLMGNTASYRIPIHLHYEVLSGEWGDQAGSFALTPINMFERVSEN